MGKCLGFRVLIPIMETQIEQNMEAEMDMDAIWGLSRECLQPISRGLMDKILHDPK